MANDLTCAARKTTFRTRKRFHNKQYPPKSKEKQPHRSDHTHFDIGFNNGNLQCTVKPLFFFFHTKSQPFNKKQPIGTINQIKQSERTIQKTNLQNKHDKLSHQLTAKSITQTTTTNNPHNLPIKNKQKQTLQAITTKSNVFWILKYRKRQLLPSQPQIRFL